MSEFVIKIKPGNFSIYSEGMDIIKKASENIFERLGWNIASRDQAEIAAKLANEQKVHKIYGLWFQDMGGLGSNQRYSHCYAFCPPFTMSISTVVGVD